MERDEVLRVREALRRTFGPYAARGIRSAFVRPSDVIAVLDALDASEAKVEALRARLDALHAALMDALSSAR